MFNKQNLILFVVAFLAVIAALYAKDYFAKRKAEKAMAMANTTPTTVTQVTTAAA